MPGTKFEDVVRIYVFDQKLRVLVIEALERFEVAVRSMWSHQLSAIGGPHSHLNSEWFENKETYNQSLKKLEEDIQRSLRNSEEIQHYFNKYDSPDLPPIWSSVAVMSFGELFEWIKNTKSTEVKKAVAFGLGFPSIRSFEGTARSLRTVRNICAHFGRLWDRRFSTRLPSIRNGLGLPLQTKTVGKGEIVDNKLYNFLVVLSHVMLSLNNDSTWPGRVAKLVNENLSDEFQEEVMGFPKGWQNEEFWQLPTEILADSQACIAELKNDPVAIVKMGQGAPVAILNRGIPEFYCVPAKTYAAIQEVVDDATLQKLVQLRKNEKLVEVDLSADLQPVRPQK